MTMQPVQIEAPLEAVWELLRSEAQVGVDSSRALILTESRPRELLLEVRMGIGFQVQHAYRLQREASGCSVEDRVRPTGWRWRVSNVFLFGRGIRAIEAAAELGLQNLKQAAEQPGDTGHTGHASQQV